MNRRTGRGAVPPPQSRTHPTRRSRRTRGETLVETLASLLIAVSAMLILAGGIATGARVNREADTRRAVVFPPPIAVGSSAFTPYDVSAEFLVYIPDSDARAELRTRVSSSDTDTLEGGTEIPLESAPVTVKRILAQDKSGNEITWRILYVFETS